MSPVRNQGVMLAFVLSCLAAAACVGDSGTEADVVYCEEVVAKESIAPDAPIDGFSANQWAALDATAQTLRYRRAPGESTNTSALELTLSLDATRAQRVLRRGRADTTEDCAERIELPATLLVRSADGAFDETLTASALIENGKLALRASLALTSLQGSYRPTGFPATFTELRVMLFMDSSGASHGSLMLEAPESSSFVSGDVGAW